MLSRYAFLFFLILHIIFLYEFSFPAVFAGLPFSITEIQIEGIRANDEFIRLNNTGTAAIDLTGFRISQTIYSKTKDTCTEETLVTASRFNQKSIPKDGHFLIVHPDYANFHPLEPPADLLYPASNTLTKNTMEITLFDAQGVVVDKRILGTACGTLPPEPEPLPNIGVLHINEIFPDPEAPEDVGEYIELFNPGDTPVDLSDWKITDATKTGIYTFPDKTSIPANGYYVIDDTDFHFSLNNTEESLSLFDPLGALVDTVTYTKTTENASLNRTDTGWRSSRMLTPLAPNILSNTLPETKERVPKKGYRNIALDFRANGKDADQDRLKYVWDFGDGHKSYLEDTNHRYAKSGTYTVTLTTKDGNEEIIETFRLKIEKFDPPKLRITRLLPNPTGKDTGPGAEWIEIENNTKKNVNLFDYSIATGTKKLVNHPIRTSFIIPKKSVRRLTHAQALFTLPNQKGKVELRAPNGKPIHTLKYNFATSLTDDTVLQKEKGEPIKTIVPTENPPTPPPQSPTTEGVSAPAAASATTVSSDPEMDTSSPVLPSAPPADMNNTRFLELTTLGTSLAIPEHQTIHPTPEIRTDEWLTPDPHYALVFLDHLSAETNAQINALFSSDK
ncbi:MAG: lamin tail domain-containing protein [Candidatus Moranbacteria bacterium]|nr:lamin tail domain-containing protein [Candidatus Moranbacteria bacterium]